jgi:ankyrin repeat protein
MEKFTVLLKIKGATDNERNTPLLIASMRGLCGVMELLLAASADAAAKNKKGKGVLDHTKEIKDEEKRAAVLALMAECSVLCAVATGKADLVAAAVAKGCNIKETDQEGNSGIHIAAAQGSNDILCILRQVRMCSLTNEFSDRSTGLRTQANSQALCVSLSVSASCNARPPPATYTSRPHAGFPMSAHVSRLCLCQRHLRSLVQVWVWVWDCR